MNFNGWYKNEISILKELLMSAMSFIVSKGLL